MFFKYLEYEITIENVNGSLKKNVNGGKKMEPGAQMIQQPKAFHFRK